jgi:phage terminase Nu1 subunit (DNA packaging protein)
MVKGNLTGVELAKGLGLSQAAVSKLKRQGMPASSLEAAQEWRRAHQNVAQRKPGPAADATKETHDSARTRLRIAEANRAEMLESELRGALIRVDAFVSVASSTLSAVRESLMQLPARVAALVAHESDVGAVQTLLEKEMARALQEAAEIPQRILQQSARRE